MKKYGGSTNHRKPRRTKTHIQVDSARKKNVSKNGRVKLLFSYITKILYVINRTYLALLYSMIKMKNISHSGKGVP